MVGHILYWADMVGHILYWADMAGHILYWTDMVGTVRSLPSSLKVSGLISVLSRFEYLCDLLFRLS